jgi:subtilase family serine protease
LPTLARSLRRLLARAGTVALSLPVLASGGFALPAAVAGHMSPAIGSVAQLENLGAPSPGANPFPCRNRTVRICYGPDQMRVAYGFDSLYRAGLTGAGQTIVIVDAFGSPAIRSDLAGFDSIFGLPDPVLNIIAPNGLLPFSYQDPNMVGWAGEVSLDVEWSHAIAPGATIDLVLAKTNNDSDILDAQQYAIDHKLGSVISQSFGEGETCMPAAIQKASHQAFEKATMRGITLLASSGDQGAAQPTCDGSGNFFLSASTPASDPLNTAVGGTSLFADRLTGVYDHETAWGDAFGRSGGGFSTLYARPDYQTGTVASAGRGVPDIAYNAGVDGGVALLFTQNGVSPGFFRSGGTSAGSPQWAGLVALANQSAGHSLGFLNPTLYAIGRGSSHSSAFHDITVGDNNWPGVAGFSAGPGWDAVTGLGTPKANVLVPLLVAASGD